MSNGCTITLENHKGHHHPLTLYLHWNGGIESVLAFMTYTWERFERGHGEMYTFHARLCQVIGNFFPDGLSFYGYSKHVQADNGDNGNWHFRINKDNFELVNRPEAIEEAYRHEYWTQTPAILDHIKDVMGENRKDDLILRALQAAETVVQQHNLLSTASEEERCETIKRYLDWWNDIAVPAIEVASP